MEEGNPVTGHIVLIRTQYAENGKVLIQQERYNFYLSDDLFTTTHLIIYLILDECEMEEWSTWSECLKCKGGNQTRSRKILKLPILKNQDCPPFPGFEDMRSCKIDPCPCKYLFKPILYY